jgi:phytoene desaturase
MKPKAVVIGSGFSSLSAACYLSKDGYDVTVVEKNSQVGGRARIYQEKGFSFDMGPSWYWMPDVFDNFFRDFGKKTEDYYQLTRLNPSYRVIFEKDEMIDLPSDINEIFSLFESIETGSSHKLKKLLEDGQKLYNLGIYDYTRRPSLKLTEFFDPKLIFEAITNRIFNSFGHEIDKHFDNQKLRYILKFPVLFLGADPYKTPYMYALMNYTDMILGTWYPAGGMQSVAKGMMQLAREQGVEFMFDVSVTSFDYEKNGSKEKVVAVNIEQNQSPKSAKIKIDGAENFESKLTNKNSKIPCDIVVSGADYEFTEQKLLNKEYRRYNKKYWNTRVMAPSSVLFFLGLNTKLPNILHHTLLFDEDLNTMMDETYNNIKWPTKPLMYLNIPALTEPDTAPKNSSNLFVLIPVASGLVDTNEIIEKYYKIVVDKIKKYVDIDIEKHLVVKKSYAQSNFITDYNSFKGNAYGLANTLLQTAVFKPKLKPKKLNNFYYTGQLTVPGPGVPPSIISGQVVSQLIKKEHGRR